MVFIISTNFVHTSPLPRGHHVDLPLILTLKISKLLFVLNYYKNVVPCAGIVPSISGLTVQRAIIRYTTEAVAMMMKIVLYISNPTPNPTPNPKINPNVTNPNPNPTPNPIPNPKLSNNSSKPKNM